MKPPFPIMLLAGLFSILLPIESGTAFSVKLIETNSFYFQPLYGAGPEQKVFVSIFHIGEFQRKPFVILLHGRPPTKNQFSSIGLAKYPANSSYFASLGFAVIVPTRVGYGVTGGPDIEFTGDCDNKNYKQGMDALVLQIKEVIKFAKTLKFVDPNHGLIVGESFGGFGAIAIAAQSDMPEIVGTINIEGGDGGDYSHLDEPCQPERIKSTFAYYGKFNQKPTLWMYSKNDRFWGEKYPKEWFYAFQAAGGKGQFVSLPADKNNGHFIFNRNAEAWHPAFENFTKAVGFSIKKYQIKN